MTFSCLSVGNILTLGSPGCDCQGVIDELAQSPSVRTPPKKTLNIGAAADDAQQRIARQAGSVSQRALASASAVEQQATVAREVDRNLTNIKDLSAQVAAGTKQTQASSVALAQLATGLNDRVAHFRV